MGTFEEPLLLSGGDDVEEHLRTLELTEG